MAVAELLDAELLTPAQAARVLDRSKVRVLQLTDAGTLPCIRTPLGRLLPAGAVRDFVKARGKPKLGARAASAPAEPITMPVDAAEGGAGPVTHEDVMRVLRASLT